MWKTSKEDKKKIKNQYQKNPLNPALKCPKMDMLQLALFQGKLIRYELKTHVMMKLKKKLFYKKLLLKYESVITPI